MPLQDAGCDVLCQVEVLAHAVAIVIMRDVLSPVHQWRPWLFGHLSVVVGIHLFVATIGLNYWSDEHDCVVTNFLDEWRLFDDQAVGQFHQHLWATGLRGVDAARDPVDRFARVNQLLCLLLRRLARIGEGR